MSNKAIEWIKSSKSSFLEVTWEARFWVALAIAGIVYPPLAASIPIVFFMSAWANFRSAAIHKKTLEEEVVQEELEEVEEDVDEVEEDVDELQKEVK